MHFDRRLITHFEWLLPLLVLAVCVLGTMTVYSATQATGEHGPSTLTTRQVFWLGAGCFGMFAVLLFDYRRLEPVALLVYLVVLVGVIAVPFIGRIGGGSRRWIPLGPLSLQPSEFMKLALVLALASHFSRTRPGPLGLREAIVPLVLMAIPAAAILAQPDLGSAAIVGIVAFTMLLVGGVRLRWFAALGAPVIVLAPIMWRHLKAYQQRRTWTRSGPATTSSSRRSRSDRECCGARASCKAPRTT